MNKSELVEVAAQEAGITKAAADKALSAIVNAVVGAVAKGDSVTLVERENRTQLPVPRVADRGQERQSVGAAIEKDRDENPVRLRGFSYAVLEKWKRRFPGAVDRERETGGGRQHHRADVHLCLPVRGRMRPFCRSSKTKF